MRAGQNNVTILFHLSLSFISMDIQLVQGISFHDIDTSYDMMASFVIVCLLKNLVKLWTVYSGS